MNNGLRTPQLKNGKSEVRLPPIEELLSNMEQKAHGYGAISHRDSLRFQESTQTHLPAFEYLEESHFGSFNGYSNYSSTPAPGRFEPHRNLSFDSNYYNSSQLSAGTGAANLLPSSTYLRSSSTSMSLPLPGTQLPSSAPSSSSVSPLGSYYNQHMVPSSAGAVLHHHNNSQVILNEPNFQQGAFGLYNADTQTSPKSTKQTELTKRKEIKRRTKTGCWTCRQRRIKCDERKPHCMNCEKSKKNCLGYGKKQTKEAFAGRT